MKGPCDFLDKTFEGEEKCEGEYKEQHMSLYPGFLCLSKSDVEVPYVVLPMECILGAEVLDAEKGQWQVIFQRNDGTKLRWVFVNSKHPVIAAVWVRHVELCCEHFGGARTAVFPTEGNFWEEPDALLLHAVAAQPGWTNPLHNMLKEQRDQHIEVLNEGEPTVRVQRLLSQTLNTEEQYLVEEAKRVAPFWRKIPSKDGRFRYFNLDTKKASFVVPPLVDRVPLINDEEADFFHASFKPAGHPTELQQTPKRESQSQISEMGTL